MPPDSIFFENHRQIALLTLAEKISYAHAGGCDFCGLPAGGRYWPVSGVRGADALEDLQKSADCRASEAEGRGAGRYAGATGQVKGVAQGNHCNMAGFFSQSFDGGQLIFKNMGVVGKKDDAGTGVKFGGCG